MDPVFEVQEDDGSVTTCPLLSRDGQEPIFNAALAAMVGVGPKGYVEAMRRAVEHNVGSSQTDVRTGRRIAPAEVKRLKHLFKAEYAKIQSIESSPVAESTLRTLQLGTERALADGHDYATAVSLTAFGLSVLEADVGDSSRMAGGTRVQVSMQAGNHVPEASAPDPQLRASSTAIMSTNAPAGTVFVPITDPDQ